MFHCITCIVHCYVTKEVTDNRLHTSWDTLSMSVLAAACDLRKTTDSLLTEFLTSSSDSRASRKLIFSTGDGRSVSSSDCCALATGSVKSGLCKPLPSCDHRTLHTLDLCCHHLHTPLLNNNPDQQSLRK